jgi:hypothetical protein
VGDAVDIFNGLLQPMLPPIVSRVAVCLWSVVVQVFSCFLPNVSLERTSSWAKDGDDRSFSFDDSAILIKRGVLIHGQC